MTVDIDGIGPPYSLYERLVLPLNYMSILIIYYNNYFVVISYCCLIANFLNGNP